MPALRIGPLTDRDVAAGEVTAWVPTTGTLEAILDVAVDPRRPSYEQLHRLRSTHADPAPDAPNPWIAFGVRLPGADGSSVAETLHRYVDRHETLRSSLLLSPGGDVVRRTLPAGSVRFERRPLGRTRTPAQTRRVLEDYLGRQTHPLSWPSYAFVTVGHPDPPHVDAVTLFGAFDHLVYDGYSTYNDLSKVPESHAAVLRGEPAGAPAASHVDFSDAEHTRWAGLGVDDPQLDPWREIVDEHGVVAPPPEATGVRRGDLLPHALFSLPVASRADSEAFARLMGASGHSSAMAFTALLVQAIADLGEPTVRCLFSVHGRPDPAAAESTGWYARLAPLRIDLTGALDLGDSAERTHAAWRRSTDASELPLPLVAQTLGRPLHPCLVVSYIYGERLPGHHIWPRYQSRTFVGAVRPSDQIHLWISRMPEGTSLDIRIPDLPQTASWAGSVAARMHERLSAVLQPTHPQPV